MFHAVTVRILAIAACGWLLAGPADALTLGRARGAALIGRPLEITIPVTLDAPTADSPCASAELFYGDQQVAAPAVRWEASSPTQGIVRITSPTPVDEPMLTLHLRVGCNQASTRRYVMLSELPPEDEPAARAVPGRLPSTEAPVAAAAQAPAGRTARRRDVVAAAPAVTDPATQRPQAAPRAPARSPAAAAPQARLRREAAAPQARLRLEPLELGPERDPTLRISTELVAQAAVDPQKRQALAVLWQALQRSPEQGVEDAIRLQGLQRELGSVRETTRQNTTALAQMRTQVEAAQGGRRLATLLVIALAAALAALAGWIAWRWYRVHRLERVGHWFEAHGTSMQADLPTTPEAPIRAAAVPTVTRTVARKAAAPAAAAAKGGARDAGPATLPPLAVPSAWATSSEFQASRGGTVRMVGVQELIDVHDKADFFMSIGETEQALAVLEAHVHDQVETGALAWMDLLELYHSLGRRVEFERLRAEFRQRFTAQVPDYEHFDEPTASLETYSRALSRIVALWPSPKVLEVIEESIFRKPGGAGAEPFSLEAYRELVLLYHVARDLAPAEPDTSPAAATTFSDTSLQPLNMVERPHEPAFSDRERLMVPPPSARLGVDIDLDASEGPETEQPPLDFDISTFDPADASEDKRG